MRALKQMNLNYVAKVGAEPTDSFKDESGAGADDGTQLVEKCGLPDVYYAAIRFIKLALNEEPNKLSENLPDSVSPSQIIRALEERYANRKAVNLTTDTNKNNIAKNAADITALSKTVSDNFGTAHENSNGNLRKDVNTNKTGITANTGNITTINGNIGKLQADISTAKTGITKNAADITALSKTVSDNFGTAHENSNGNLRKDIDGLSVSAQVVPFLIQEEYFAGGTTRRYLRADLSLRGIDIDKVVAFSASGITGSGADSVFFPLQIGTSNTVSLGAVRIDYSTVGAGGRERTGISVVNNITNFNGFNMIIWCSK